MSLVVLLPILENLSFAHILPKELLAGVVGAERLEVVSAQQAAIDTSLPFLLQVAMLMFRLLPVMTALSKISLNLRFSPTSHSLL